MTEHKRARHAKLAWKRVAALLLILTTLLSSPLAGPWPAEAAPPAQTPGLCTLVPPGYDPSPSFNGADYCNAIYNEPDGTMFFLELTRAYSPASAYGLMPCDPGACQSGGTCNSQPCYPMAAGDLPAGARFGAVDYAATSTGGYASAWTRGCYLLVGQTYENGSEARDKLSGLMRKADALIASGPCAGCSDPSVCQEGAGAALAVTALKCSYLATHDMVQCSAQVVNAPDPRDITYEWRFDGSVVEGETASVLDLIVPPDGKVHSVRVTARDEATGKTSAPAATTVQTGTGGSIKVQTASGTTSVGGPDTATSVVLNANEQLAKVLADCPLLGLALLLEIGFDEELALDDPGPQSAGIIIAALVIDCAKLQGKAERPLAIAAVGDPALFLPARAAPQDLPVQLRIGLQGGPVRVKASSDHVLLNMETSGASVRSAGRNDFGVNLNRTYAVAPRV